MVVDHAFLLCPSLVLCVVSRFPLAVVTLLCRDPLIRWGGEGLGEGNERRKGSSTLG